MTLKFKTICYIITKFLDREFSFAAIHDSVFVDLWRCLPCRSVNNQTPGGYQYSSPVDDGRRCWRRLAGCAPIAKRQSGSPPCCLDFFPAPFACRRRSRSLGQSLSGNISCSAAKVSTRGSAVQLGGCQPVTGS